MAINVDVVYKTVLTILNKEQRGYITPQEFNSIATNVQLEIFEQYFDDLNQLIRVQNSDSDYADRIALLEEKLSIFKTVGNCTYVTSGTGNYFTLPSVDITGQPYIVHKLGSLLYTNQYGTTVGPLEELQRGEFYYIQNSKLTASTESFPTYMREGIRIIVAPSTITTNLMASYIRKPLSPVWGFTVGSRGQYIYDPGTYIPTTVPTTGSRDFELHASEQTNVITKVLLYAGVVVKDPQIIQVAMQQNQQKEVNSKS